MSIHLIYLSKMFSNIKPSDVVFIANPTNRQTKDRRTNPQNLEGVANKNTIQGISGTAQNGDGHENIYSGY